MADIAEAGVGRKAVVSAEILLGTAVAADTASWYRSQYAAVMCEDVEAAATWEVHNIRADATGGPKLFLPCPLVGSGGSPVVRCTPRAFLGDALVLYPLHVA